MKKTGVLLHVYHLGTLGWEELVWGDPAEDRLGTLTKFADCLLGIPAADEVDAIIYSGPSEKDGLSEGAYARQFLVDHIDGLSDFPRLKRKLDALSWAERAVFTERINGLVAGPQLTTAGTTEAEIRAAAKRFAKAGVSRVLEIACVSHAPRCARSQALVRSEGLIPQEQAWFLVISETCWNHGEPLDVTILEPPHRADDPVYGLHPSLPQSLRTYQYELDHEHRREVVLKVAQLIANELADQAVGSSESK
ncbi:MAG TPA: hypothetical protein VLF69_06030 [Candidatus Saccharimonadales bacterium]|nr:hypothetical protein [Candidatus Saccharimonadales bacterium]